MKNGQAKLDFINAQTANGATVYLQTYTKCTEVTARTLANFVECGGLFKGDSKGSLYIRRGKNWDCIDYGKITARA